MRPSALLAAALALLLSPGLSGAQAPGQASALTRDDGIRAFVGGDYGAAVRILQPLAEEADPPDPVAQFFMALLYNAGAGVKGDSMHACSLLLNAAAAPSPFADTASRMVRRLQDNGVPAALCQREWGAQRPASFVLGPGHRIVMASAATTVFLGGREHRIAAPDGNPFVRYAQPVYTPLDVRKPVETRRHFNSDLCLDAGCAGGSDVVEPDVDAQRG